MRTCFLEPRRSFAVAAFASAFVAGSVHAVTVDFDEIAFPGGNPLAAASVPAGYQGLSWSGGQGPSSWVVSPNSATGWFGGTLQPYAHSGSNFAWANGGTSLELTVAGGGSFDLTSFWARSWPPTGLPTTVQGYRDGVVVASTSFTPTQIYLFVDAAGFAAIDRLAIVPSSPYSLLIDDITVANITPVPEPATAALLSAGLLALVGAHARRVARRGGRAT